MENSLICNATGRDTSESLQDCEIATSSSSSNYRYSGSDPKLCRLSDMLSDIRQMAEGLCEIKKTYSLINIEKTDILVTMADTNEILSVNELVKFYRENKALMSSK